MSSFLPSLFERNPEATIYVGNIDQKVSPEIVWELFSQCGVVVNVHLPKDKISTEHQGYGFVEFRSEEDADYAIKIMHMVKLYGKPIKVNKASQDKKTQEVGANLFVGNLDKDVDEKTLYDTFSTFGLILATRIARDPDNGQSKGYGFISYDNFDSSDASLNAMNGQYFHNKVIHVSYAYKKDTKGERHGSAAERLLAANRPQQNKVNFGMMQQQQQQPGMQGMGGLPSLPQLPQLPTINKDIKQQPPMQYNSIPENPMFGNPNMALQPFPPNMMGAVMQPNYLPLGPPGFQPMMNPPPMGYPLILNPPNMQIPPTHFPVGMSQIPMQK